MAGLPPAYHRIFRASRLTISLVSLADLSQTNGNELQRTINAHKLLRHTSTPTVDSELASVQTFTKQYREGLQFGDHLPTTELQPADDLAILAGQTFVSLWTMTGDRSLISCRPPSPAFREKLLRSCWTSSIRRARERGNYCRLGRQWIAPLSGRLLCLCLASTPRIRRSS